MSDADTVASRLADIERRVASACERAGRSRAQVTLIAVSKTHPDTAVRDVVETGHRDFGESQIQAWLARHDADPPFTATPPSIRWHLIGPIQTNKAKFIGRHPPHLIHTVDRASLVKALDKALPMAVDALLQVNIDNEPQKAGCGAADLDALADLVSTAQHLRLRGLMCIPRFDQDPRPAFARLRSLGDRIADRVADGAVTLSMGMSGDFEDAITEGATHVRVGTAIFGRR
ncbi:MAG: pyridoxal phosphate enzyme (YggS family) [Myxococcota bacterium]